MKSSITPSILEECTNDNIERFNFNNRQIQAKCVKVYDGDTITVAFSLENKFYKFSVRMNGYDSPEIKSSDVLEKKYAQLSKNYLKELILGKLVTLMCKKCDKYGRIIANVVVDGKDINTLMLNNGYCVKYNGGSKPVWDFSEWEKMENDSSSKS